MPVRGSDCGQGQSAWRITDMIATEIFSPTKVETSERFFILRARSSSNSSSRNPFRETLFCLHNSCNRTEAKIKCLDYIAACNHYRYLYPWICDLSTVRRSSVEIQFNIKLFGFGNFNLFGFYCFLSNGKFPMVFYQTVSAIIEHKLLLLNG